jgi:hypothetical protein
MRVQPNNTRVEKRVAVMTEIRVICSSLLVMLRRTACGTTRTSASGAANGYRNKTALANEEVSAWPEQAFREIPIACPPFRHYAQRRPIPSPLRRMPRRMWPPPMRLDESGST